MDPQWRERGLCSHSPLLSGPLRQPSDSGLPVATPLSSSCHRGSLGSSYSVYYYLSRRRGGALCLVAYCVPTPGFQSATCSVHYYRGCGLFPPPHTHTNKLRLSFGHLNRTQTFTYHSHSYIPGLIIMFPHSECFCPIERAGCWTTSTPPPRARAPPPISQVVRLNAFTFSLPIFSNVVEYFCQCHFFFFFVFYLVCSGAFSSARKKRIQSVLLLLYCTIH